MMKNRGDVMLVFSRVFVLNAISSEIRARQKYLVENKHNIFMNMDLRALEEMEDSINASTSPADTKILLSFTEAGLLNIKTDGSKLPGSYKKRLQNFISEN
jgi:hypothetical protein